MTPRLLSGWPTRRRPRSGAHFPRSIVRSLVHVSSARFPPRAISPASVPQGRDYRDNALAIRDVSSGAILLGETADSNLQRVVFLCHGESLLKRRSFNADDTLRAVIPLLLRRFTIF